ncbi:unnamed protein product, partial [Prorocentrum cordatum]
CVQAAAARGPGQRPAAWPPSFSVGSPLCLPLPLLPRPLPPALDAMAKCDGVVCCFGCMSLIPGFTEHVVDKLAFFPPKPPGYPDGGRRPGRSAGEGELDGEGLLEALPDFSTEGIQVAPVTMHTSRGSTIYGVHFRRLDATKTVLFSHGNSADCGSSFVPCLELCRELRVNVLVYDYTGYGLSSGGNGQEVQVFFEASAPDFFCSDHLSTESGVSTQTARKDAQYTAANGTVVPHKSHARELGAHLNYTAMPARRRRWLNEPTRPPRTTHPDAPLLPAQSWPTWGRIDVATTLDYSRDLGDLAAGTFFACLTGLVYTQKDFAKIAGDEVDDALATFGIVETTDSERVFWAHLESCAPTAPPDWLALRLYVDDDGHMNFFSDGSADPADDARWRVAGSRVVFRMYEADGFFWRVVVMKIKAHTERSDARTVMDACFWDGNDGADAAAKRGRPAHEGARDFARAECFQLAVQRRMLDARSGDDPVQGDNAPGGSAPDADGESDDLPPQHSLVWGVAHAFATPWRSEHAFLPSAVSGTQLVRGRLFYDRFFKWWRTLAWRDRCDAAPRDAYGSACIMELAILYEVQTQTRPPVKIGPGKWLLRDARASAAVLSQTLKETGMLVQAVIKVLEQHGADFAAPARFFARSWWMFGCAQESPTHALPTRPRMHIRALSTQLDSNHQMDDVFTTALGGALLIDVKGRTSGADPFSERLALHGSARSALEQADLELSAAQEGRAQLAAAKPALAQGGCTVYTLTDVGALTRPSPSRAAGQPAKQSRRGIAFDDAGRPQARTRLHFWAGSVGRNRLSAASGCRVFGFNTQNAWWECFLCDRVVNVRELGRAWKRPELAGGPREELEALAEANSAPTQPARSNAGDKRS